MSAFFSRGALAALLALGLVTAPRLASACAVCTSGRDDETRLAFLLTTLFLSVMPLAMIGGMVWWLVRRARAAARRAEPSQEAGAAAGVSPASSSP